MRMLWYIRAHRGIVLSFIALCVFIVFFHTPAHEPRGSFVRIEAGESFGVIAADLEAHNVITSPLLFRAATMLVGGTTNVQAGTYRFDVREPLIVVARRLATGDYRIVPVRIIFPEGSTVHEMGEILERQLGTELAVQFKQDAASFEGSLFPDTYLILPTTTSAEIVALLRTTFDERTRELKERAASSSRSWNEVLTMASIIEEEVRTDEDRRIVSGILWKRVDEGMRLQVDASFSYLFGKASSEVTLDDMAFDSPYNTYKYAGLPPGPITNPGIAAIEAALDPLETSHWFYLSGDDGTTHYAETYEEHLANKAKYID